MCGLTAAYAKKLSAKDIEILKTLMDLSDMRGGWGSGEVSVSDTGNLHIIKHEFSAYDLVTSKTFSDRLKTPLSLVIGHSRYPTKGSVSRANSHPHSNQKVIGVHNGTFRKILGQDIKDNENDSKKFYEAVANEGIHDAVIESSGAYALMWIDKELKEFRILRNFERPLWMVKTRQFYGAPVGKYTGMFFSSEKRMLEFALDRCNSLQNAVFTEVPVNKMMCLPLNPEAEILPDPVIVEVPEFLKKTYSGHSSYWDSKDLADLDDYGVPDFKEFRGSRVAFRDGKFIDQDNKKEVLLSWMTPKVASEKTCPDTLGVQTGVRLGTGQNKIIIPSKKNVPVLVKPESEIQKVISKTQRRASKGSAGFRDQGTNLCDIEDFDDPDKILKETEKGHYVTLSKFEELIDNGCCWCSAIPDTKESYSKTKGLRWISQKEFLCSECRVDKEALFAAGVDDRLQA